MQYGNSYGILVVGRLKKDIFDMRSELVIDVLGTLIIIRSYCGKLKCNYKLSNISKDALNKTRSCLMR